MKPWVSLLAVRMELHTGLPVKHSVSATYRCDCSKWVGICRGHVIKGSDGGPLEQRKGERHADRVKPWCGAEWPEPVNGLARWVPGPSGVALWRPGRRRTQWRREVRDSPEHALTRCPAKVLNCSVLGAREVAPCRAISSFSRHAPAPIQQSRRSLARRTSTLQRIAGATLSFAFPTRYIVNCAYILQAL